MSVDGWNAVLVLGGIRSGKSQFAESLISDAAAVRYVATAAPGRDDDQEWAARIAAHRNRRPGHWSTEETGSDPARLATIIAGAKPEESLLIDDLGGWVAALLFGGVDHAGEIDPGTASAPGPADQGTPDRNRSAENGVTDALADAIRTCRARVVLVSPEVGLSVVPATSAGRAFADVLGETNQAVARACDAVVLVMAGQPTWLKPTAAEVVAVAATERSHEVRQVAETRQVVESGAAPAVEVPAMVEATTAEAEAGAVAEAGEVPLIEAGMDLPMPDEDAVGAAELALRVLDMPGAGLGELSRVVAFAAGAQATATPRPWRAPHVLLLHGRRGGDASAGEDPDGSARRIEQALAGTGPLGVLAARAGARIRVVEAPAAEPMEHGPALTPDQVTRALANGWRAAADAVNAGADILVIGACGTGADAAATAVLAATAGSEPAAVLPRVIVSRPAADAVHAGPAGTALDGTGLDETGAGGAGSVDGPGPDGTAAGKQIDDLAWMVRCAAVRDALHRTRRGSRDAHDVLAELGGGDIAVATGILLGAAARRVPVLLDGPVGVAAALVSRDLAGQARHWCLLPDHGRNPLLRVAADVLGLTPFTDLGMDAGEGVTALAALPLLVAALELASPQPLDTAAPGASGASGAFDARVHGG